MGVRRAGWGGGCFLVPFTQHGTGVTLCLYIPTSTTCKETELFGTRIASTMQKLKKKKKQQLFVSML